MLLSFDLAGEILDELAEAFPPEFYRDLNGGISLLPECKEDPEAPPGELYVLGEYCSDQMGRYINLYYGSFAALAHEFTHHIEGLAGERGLELKDAQFMEDFRARNGE